MVPYHPVKFEGDRQKHLRVSNIYTHVTDLMVTICLYEGSSFSMLRDLLISSSIFLVSGVSRSVLGHMPGKTGIQSTSHSVK